MNEMFALHAPVSREIIAQDPSVQVQRVTCCDPSICLHLFEVHSLDSSKMMGNLPEVLSCHRLFLNLNRFICD